MVTYLVFHRGSKLMLRQASSWSGRKCERHKSSLDSSERCCDKSPSMGAVSQESQCKKGETLRVPFSLQQTNVNQRSLKTPRFATQTLNTRDSIPNVTVYSGDCGRSSITMCEVLSAKAQNSSKNLEARWTTAGLFDFFSCSAWISWSFFVILSDVVKLSKRLSSSSRSLSFPKRSRDLTQASWAGA